MKSATPRLHGMGMAAAGWMTDGRVARRRLDTECVRFVQNGAGAADRRSRVLSLISDLTQGHVCTNARAQGRAHGPPRTYTPYIHIM